jgi:hypothetical protein
VEGIPGSWVGRAKGLRSRGDERDSLGEADNETGGFPPGPSTSRILVTAVVRLWSASTKEPAELG